MRLGQRVSRGVVIAWLSATLCGGNGVSVSAAGSALADQFRVASIPLEIAGDNYVLIKARVNDSDPLTFLVDSGGGPGLVLYHKAAEALKLTAAGKGTGAGAGERAFVTASVKNASLH